MKVVGHRGSSATAPQNKMAAFTTARAVGADGVELDVHHTRDGELVVIDDYAVDRTTNGTGLDFDLPADTVQRLDAGSWFAPEFRDEHVPIDNFSTYDPDADSEAWKEDESEEAPPTQPDDDRRSIFDDLAAGR